MSFSVEIYAETEARLHCSHVEAANGRKSAGQGG